MLLVLPSKKGIYKFDYELHFDNRWIQNKDRRLDYRILIKLSDS